MPYIYSIRRPNQVKQYAAPVKAVVVEPEPEPELYVSYRDLQAQAKALGISGKQTADELKEAIAESTSDE